MVPQETLGAPLKPFRSSGAASATAGSAPVFFQSSTTSFFGGAQEFFFSTSNRFFIGAGGVFFCSSNPFILGGTIMSFQKKRITFECDEATHMKIQSLLGNKTYLNTKDYQNLFQSTIKPEHMKTSKESNSSKQTYKSIKDKLQSVKRKKKIQRLQTTDEWKGLENYENSNTSIDEAFLSSTFISKFRKLYQSNRVMSFKDWLFEIEDLIDDLK